MFSVDTEEEAKKLLVVACPTNINGQYVAPELAREQTLENLYAFSDRLDRAWKFINKAKMKANRTSNSKQRVKRL